MNASAPDFTFVSRNPPGVLARFVESLWYARGTIGHRRERIAPTGSCVAVIVLGDPIVVTPRDGAGPALVATTGFLIGPHGGPVINEPTGETYAVGIVTTPVGCRPVFGCDPASLRGLVIELADAWAAMHSIRDRLAVETDPEVMLDLLHDQLSSRLDHEEAGAARCSQALTVLEAQPTVSIRDLAATVGVSHGFLDREFLRVIGLTPRAFSRIVRLRRVLESIDVFGPVNWTRVCTDFGWFDQSHFIRDFKRHTGVTPSTYLRLQRELFTPVDAIAGFVPER